MTLKKVLDDVLEMQFPGDEPDEAPIYGFYDYQCCMTCAAAAADEEITEWNAARKDKGLPQCSTYFGYHGQDADMLRRTGNVYLWWRGDGAEICKRLRRFGFTVKWNHDPNQRILITGWKKRNK
jgi:hypothetical protein